MYKLGDHVVYKTYVCIINEIKEKYLNNKDYYILNPIDDTSLVIYVPVENEETALRTIIPKDASEKLIKKIPDIDLLDINDKMLENNYKRLMKNGTLEDMVQIIKTAYTRIEDKKALGKKVGEKDNNYFKKAERVLYNELSVSLGMSFDDTKEYVVNKVHSMNISA